MLLDLIKNFIAANGRNCNWIMVCAADCLYNYGMITCPLCGSSNTIHFHTDKARRYVKCADCELVFVPDEFHLDPLAEKCIYDQHENNPSDPGYRQFLSRLFRPMCDRIPIPATGLDFGSGSGPTLSTMFEEAGYQMKIYDRYYANRPEVLGKPYDFISCSEVLEHLYQPGLVLSSLVIMIRQGGWLGVMTKLVESQAAFVGWHYKNDPTHVCFYSRETFRWISRHYNLQLHFIGKDVILLRKLAAADTRECA